MQDGLGASQSEVETKLMKDDAKKETGVADTPESGAAPVPRLSFMQRLKLKVGKKKRVAQTKKKEKVCSLIR